MKNKVYLAGGMRSNWHEKVVSSCKLEFFNPREKEIRKDLTLQEFGSWDLHHIKMSDIVFGYMEKTNPSGIGMAVELGYAKGIGKTIILCIEDDNPYISNRYLDFMKKVADVVYTNIEDAINYLKLYEGK